MMYPVRDLAEFGSVDDRSCQEPASTKHTSPFVGSGLKRNPLSRVRCRYLHIRFTATSCDSLGSLQKTCTLLYSHCYVRSNHSLKITEASHDRPIIPKVLVRFSFLVFIHRVVLEAVCHDFSLDRRWDQPFPESDWSCVVVPTIWIHLVA